MTRSLYKHPPWDLKPPPSSPPTPQQQHQRQRAGGLPRFHREQRHRRFWELVRGGDADAVQQLVHDSKQRSSPVHFVDVNIRSGPCGWTPLQYACLHGHTTLAQWLLQHPEVDVNATTTHQGFTALHYAAFYNRVDLVRLLLQHPWLRRSLSDHVDCRTALHWASQRGHVECVKVLLGAPLAPEESTVAGTAAVVAEFQAADREGCTPLDLARASHKEAVVDVLLEFWQRRPRNTSTPQAVPHHHEEEEEDAATTSGAASILGDLSALSFMSLSDWKGDEDYGRTTVGAPYPTSITLSVPKYLSGVSSTTTKTTNHQEWTEILEIASVCFMIFAQLGSMCYAQTFSNKATPVIPASLSEGNKDTASSTKEEDTMSIDTAGLQTEQEEEEKNQVDSHGSTISTQEKNQIDSHGSTISTQEGDTLAAIVDKISAPQNKYDAHQLMLDTWTEGARDPSPPPMPSIVSPSSPFQKYGDEHLSVAATSVTLTESKDSVLSPIVSPSSPLEKYGDEHLSVAATSVTMAESKDSVLSPPSSESLVLSPSSALDKYIDGDDCLMRLPVQHDRWEQHQLPIAPRPSPSQQAKQWNSSSVLVADRRLEVPPSQINRISSHSDHDAASVTTVASTAASSTRTGLTAVISPNNNNGNRRCSDMFSGLSAMYPRGSSLSRKRVGGKSRTAKQHDITVQRLQTQIQTLEDRNANLETTLKSLEEQMVQIVHLCHNEFQLSSKKKSKRSSSKSHPKLVTMTFRNQLHDGASADPSVKRSASHHITASSQKKPTECPPRIVSL